MQRYFAALLCLYSCFAVWGQTTASQRTEVAGTVLDSASGQPIAGATVILEAGPAQRARLKKESKPLPPQRAFTDHVGKFSFSVPSTSAVFLRVARRGYRSEGQQDVASIPVNIEDARNIIVKLVPLGAIHGRVVNSDGEPLPGVNVQAIRIDIRGGRRVLSEYANKTTDDLGEYRLWHLSPGLFYLKVAGRLGTAAGLGEMPIMPESDEAYGPLYYPAAASQEAAQAVRMNPGQTIRADFTIAGQKAYKIRGALQGFTPYDRPTIRLLRGDDPVGNRSAVNLASGAFEVFDVTPGTYILQAYTANSQAPTFGEAMVTVVNRDVPGVIVAANPGAEVRGTVDFTGTPPQPSQPARAGSARRFVTVQATPTSPNRLPVGSRSGNANVDENGRFSLKLLPGHYEIGLYAAGYYIASIRSGTADVLADGLTVGAGGAPELNIVLAAGGARIEATVTDLGAETRPTVVVVRRYGSSIIPTMVYGPREGRFVAENLAPGEYTVYAWPSGREVEYYNLAALQALSAYAVPVSLRDGATEQVRLKAAPREER